MTDKNISEAIVIQNKSESNHPSATETPSYEDDASSFVSDWNNRGEASSSKSHPVPVSLSSVMYNSRVNLGFPSVLKDTLDTGLIKPNVTNRTKFDYTGPDSGPSLYNITSNLTTEPIVVKKLPDAFKDFPVYGKPASKSELDPFYKKKIREYVGTDLSNAEFENLAEYCSPEHLKTGKEIILETSLPTQGLDLKKIQEEETIIPEMIEDESLCVLKKFRLRVQQDMPSYYSRKFKYRGVKLRPLTNEQEDETVHTGKPLEPGKDLLFKIKIYRTFPCNTKIRTNRFRHSVLSTEVVVCGPLELRELRSRIVCPNDIGSRTDVSECSDFIPNTAAKDLFPSGLLFINNVFYVDCRKGCIDYSAPIREWAEARGIGTFQMKDIDKVQFQDLTVKLGHPELYMHQGNCEHLFTFSEIRLVRASDPLNTSCYPILTAMSHNHTVYCTTCAEYGAKWVVVDCPSVPFDPAFFCDICFKLYLYKDGKKICEFKAYAYKGNEINLLKPTG